MNNQCLGKTRKGEQCKLWVLGDKLYCKHHREQRHQQKQKHQQGG